MGNMIICIRDVENLARNSRKTLQVLPKANQNAHNPINVSKASPKAAKVHQKSPKGDPEKSTRIQIWTLLWRAFGAFVSEVSGF